MPTRTPDFRYFFASTLGFAWSDNDCRLIFGIEDGGGPETAIEQTGVVMTHKTAKLLARYLTTIVESYELKTGQEIPYDPEKDEGLRATLDEANQASIVP